MERNLFDRLLVALAFCAGAVLLALMAMVGFDVIMRYVLRLPFLGGFELTELAMVLIVFLALPYCGATDGHVAVDVFAGVLDRPALRAVSALVHLAGGILMAIVAWQAVLYALGARERNEATNMLGIDKHPFQLVTAVGAGIFALVLLRQAVRVIRRPRSPALRA